MKKLVHTFFILALAMALVTAGVTGSVLEGGEEEEENEAEEIPLSADDAAALTGVSLPQDPSFSLRGASRFLAGVHRNPRAYNCRKNPKICLAKGSPGPHCCRNKCVDLKTDHRNCGACGMKCKFTTACCRGQCVYQAFDKRHCGRCNNRCKKGEYCIYGLCNYA